MGTFTEDAMPKTLTDLLLAALEEARALERQRRELQDDLERRRAAKRDYQRTFMREWRRRRRDALGDDR